MFGFLVPKFMNGKAAGTRNPKHWVLVLSGFASCRRFSNARERLRVRRRVNLRQLVRDSQWARDRVFTGAELEPEAKHSPSARTKTCKGVASSPRILGCTAERAVFERTWFSTNLPEKPSSPKEQATVAQSSP